MAPEYDHLADALDDATAPIADELGARLEVRLSEKDWMAVNTALAKACVMGLKRGAAEFSEQLEAALPDGEGLSWELELDCTDLWQQRYGAARSGGAGAG